MCQSDQLLPAHCHPLIPYVWLRDTCQEVKHRIDKFIGHVWSRVAGAGTAEQLFITVKWATGSITTEPASAVEEDLGYASYQQLVYEYCRENDVNAAHVLLPRDS